MTSAAFCRRLWSKGVRVIAADLRIACKVLPRRASQGRRQEGAGGGLGMYGTLLLICLLQRAEHMSTCRCGL